MKRILTAFQMKEADRYTIDELHIPSIELMERAATAVFEAVRKKAKNKDAVLILCGPGNNGGDGYACARLLIDAGYERVDIVSTGREGDFTEEVEYQRKQLAQRQAVFLQDIPDTDYEVVVDALFGIGLSRDVQEPYLGLIEKTNGMNAFRIAVDIPSGVNGTTGQIHGTAFRADLTVTFAYSKTGQWLYPGASYCGQLKVVGIGIQSDPSALSPAICGWGKKDMRILPSRKASASKGGQGKLLVIAGSRNMAGPAAFAARAAYRCGCGYVTIYSPECNREILQKLIPEAVLVCYDEKMQSTEELDGLLEKSDAAVIGPGLGMEDSSEAILRHVLSSYEKPLLIDADALNLMSVCDDLFAEALSREQTVITPHTGEMARLSGCGISEIRSDMIGVLMRFLAHTNIVCVLKDARTLIGARNHDICVNTTGSVSLAKAGSGDVLAGTIGALLAKGLSCYDAACAGAYLHGKAGKKAEDDSGEDYVMALELADLIGKTYRKIKEK